MIIYKKDNSVRITIHQSDNSDVKYEISAEEYANVNIKSLDPIAFDTGDYVTLFGQRFTLYKAASIIEKFSSEHFEYTLKFESLRADLASINFVLFDNTTDGTEPTWSVSTTYEFSQKVKYNNVVYKYINPVPSTGHATSDADYWAVVRTAPIWDFPIVLDPKRYAQMVVDNINRARPNETWTVGFAIDHTPMQATFSNTNCLDALGTISGIFETEFWIGNYTVNIGKRSTTTSLTMQYGSEGGFRNITRTEVSNTKKVTRLVALGSDRNLQGTYRNGSPRLMLPTTYYLDSANIDVNNPKEETVTWDDIYPCMEHAKEDYSAGTTYSLGAQVLYNRISWDYINATPSAGHTPASGAYWKISEGTVLSAISTLKFSDENLTFNPLDSTYAMTDGTKPKVAFLTGNLAGYEFPISNFDPLTKTITLETIEDGTDNILPAKDYGFSYGDQYFFVDLYMPQSYITKAENRLLAKATEYLEKYSKDQISYRGDVSTIWATNNAVNLAIGDLITVIDTDFGINDAYRIINLTRNITNPYKYSIELSQLPYIPSRIESIENSINDNQNQIDRNGSDKQMFKVHTYRGAKEAIDMAFDPEGNYFTDKIKPLIVETSQILIGTSSQQYALTGLVFSTLSSDPNTVSWTAGTITDSTMETSQRAWNIAAGTFVADADPLKSYYCYIVCPRATGALDATISFSEAQILVKQDNTNYYFLFGTLGKLIDGIRQLWTSKGFTFISGDTIVTGRIKNTTGTVDINLTEGKMVIGSGAQSLQYNVDGDGKLKITGTIEAVAGLIAGWTIGTDTISKGNVILGADGSISNVIDGVVYWTLNPDGSGSVGKGGITWNAAGEISGSFTTLENNGDLNVDGSIFASGAIVAGALNGTLPDDLPVSSPLLYGVSKYDDVTIKINANGQLYVATSGGTVVSFGTEVAGQSIQLIVAAITKTLALAGHTHNYLSSFGGTLSGVLYTDSQILFNNNTLDLSWGGYINGKATINGNGGLNIYPLGNLFSGDVTINSNKVWHAGNDGADSGLDADLLRGVAPSNLAVLSATKLANTRYLWGQPFTGEGDVNGTLVQELNNTWLTPARIQLGRFGTSVYNDRSVIGVTNGNLHIDGYNNHGIYLNYYQGIGSANKALIILPSGNICVGSETDFGYKVDVNGTFRSVGAAYLNSTLAVTSTSTFTGLLTANGGVTAANVVSDGAVVAGALNGTLPDDLPVATSSLYGVVKFDPTTLALNGSNQLTVIGGSWSDVEWGTPTAQYTPLTVDAITRNLSLDGHTHSYLPLSGGTLIGVLYTDSQILFNNNTLDLSWGGYINGKATINGNGGLNIYPLGNLFSGDVTINSNKVWHAGNLSIGAENLFNNGGKANTYSSSWQYIYGLKDDEQITVQIWCDSGSTAEVVCFRDNGYSLNGSISTTTGYGKRTYTVKPYTTNANNNGTVLILITATNAKIKVERGNQSTDISYSWSDYLASNVASATKLATTRTIWGQNFNGEANVSGALSGATTGTFSSTISATTGIFSNLTANYIPKHTPGGLANSLVYDNGTYVGINRTDAAYNLDVNGTFRSVGAAYLNSTLEVTSYATASRFYTGYDAGLANSFSCSNWFRSNGATGWLNATYNAGILSDTANIVRTYNTNKFKVYNTAIDSILTLGGVTAANVVSSGAVVAGALNGTLPDDLPIATTSLFGVIKTGLSLHNNVGVVNINGRHYTTTTSTYTDAAVREITAELSLGTGNMTAGTLDQIQLAFAPLTTTRGLTGNIIATATGAGMSLTIGFRKDTGSGRWYLMIYNGTASTVVRDGILISIRGQQTI